MGWKELESLLSEEEVFTISLVGQVNQKTWTVFLVAIMYRQGLHCYPILFARFLTVPLTVRWGSLDKGGLTNTLIYMEYTQVDLRTLSGPTVRYPDYNRVLT